MARTGTGSFLIHGCLGAFWRAPGESDVCPRHSDSCGSSGEDNYFTSVEPGCAHENACSFSHAKTNRDGKLGPYDARAGFRHIDDSGNLNLDSATHAHSSPKRHTDGHPDAHPIAHTGSERTRYPRRTHSESTARSGCFIPYTDPDEDSYAYSFIHGHVDRLPDAFFHTHAYADPDCHSNPDAYPVPHAYALTNRFTDSPANAYVYCGADIDAYLPANSHPYANLNRYADPDALPITKFHSDCFLHTFTHANAGSLRNSDCYSNLNGFANSHSNLYTDNYPLIDFNRDKYTGSNANALANPQPHSDSHLYADVHSQSNPNAHTRYHFHIHAVAIWDCFCDPVATKNSHTKAYDDTDLHAPPIKDVCDHCNGRANRYTVSYGFADCDSDLAGR